MLDLRPVCALTDATRPYQPFIGRGEALMALEDVLNAGAAGWLAEHANTCRRMADAAATTIGIETCGPVQTHALRLAHEALMAAHGVDARAFAERVRVARSARRVEITAERDGFAHYDLARLRDLLVARQRAEPTAPTAPHPIPPG